MRNTKFVVKVNRGSRVPEYVERIDRAPIQMTTNRKQALLMGKFTAETPPNPSRTPAASQSWWPYKFLPSNFW